MRLRVKLLQTGEVVRLELPGDATLAALRQEVVSGVPQLNGSAPGDVVLSLNKKDPLSGADSDAVSGLGLCNGDVLWVLAPSVAPASTAAPAAAACAERDQAGARATSAAPDPQQLSDQGDARMDVDAPPAQQQQQQQQQEQSTGDFEDAHEGAAAVQAEAGQQEPEHLPPAKPWIPDHLQRLLDLVAAGQQQGQQQEQEQQQQHELSQLHALMLAAHAAMLESGFEPQQRQQQQQQHEPLEAVPCAFSGGRVLTGSYCLPGAGGSRAVGVEVRCMDVGQHVVLAGSLRELGAAAAAAAAAAGAAGAAVAAAAAPGEARREEPQAPAGGSVRFVLSLSLPKSHVAPCGDGGAAQETPGAGEPAVAACAGGRQDAPARVPGWPVCAFPQLPQLWVALKDRLCLPLLVAACASAGLPPPAGLATLPYELQEIVLGELPAKDLAALCCACTAMRHRASTDDLWRPMFDREFPETTAGDGGGGSGGGGGGSAAGGLAPPQRFALAHTLDRLRREAGRHGWKWAFAAAWVQRARLLAEQRRRARGAMLLHAAPRPRPMPWGPVRPDRPLMPPNVIGGDYDRLPSVALGGGLGGLGGWQAGPGGPLGGPSLGGALFSGGGISGGSGGLPGRGGGGLGGPGFPGLGGGRRREGGEGGAGFRLH